MEQDAVEYIYVLMNSCKFSSYKRIFFNIL